MRLTLAPACLILSACCFAQTATKLEFEVVSVKPAPPPDGHGISVYCNGGPGSKDPAIFRCVNMSLSNLITMAYKINYYQLDRHNAELNQMYNIDAKVPEGATKEDLPVMMQQMLADRFKLAVHHETRDLQKYELVVAKNGPKFKEAEPPPPPKEDDTAGAPRPAGPRGPLKLAADGYPDLEKGRMGMAMMNGRARLQNPQMTMQMLASQIVGQMGGPVTDATGLTGKYEISLYWAAGSRVPRPPSPDGSPAPAEEETGPTLTQAIQDQLGLRLESRKGPVDFVVVDHVEKSPSEN